MKKTKTAPVHSLTIAPPCDRLVHHTISHLLPVVLAVTLVTSAVAQHLPDGAAGRDKFVKTALPGSRMTVEQKQAVAAYGSDVSIQFGNREVPAFMAGSLSARAYPDDAIAEAQAALELHGAAFRRGPDDGFVFKTLDQDAGTIHVQMTQTYKGIPVEGASLTVHLSRDQVTGISGHFVPDINLAVDSQMANAQSVISIDDAGIAHVTTAVDEARATNAEVSGAASSDHALALLIGGFSNLLRNPGFESGNDGNWKGQTCGFATVCSPGAPIYQCQWSTPGCFPSTHSGTWLSRLNGYAKVNQQEIGQTVTIPSTATSATFSFWLRIVTSDVPNSDWDRLYVQIRTGDGSTVLKTFLNPQGNDRSGATFSNKDSGFYANYRQVTFDVTQYRGQTISVYFRGTEDQSYATYFYIDDSALTYTSFSPL